MAKESRQADKAAVVQTSPRGVRLRIKVQTGATKNQILGIVDQYLKIKIRAKPVAGAANHELIKFLQKKFDLPRKNIQILHGEKSRIKIVEILGITYKDYLTVVSSPH